VRDIPTRFGEIAGTIWGTLNENGCLKENQLKELTKLNEDEFQTGIGWLARENKIFRQDDDFYKIGNTNLDSEIGSHAGKIWKILDVWGDADFETLKRLSDLNEHQVYSALGWLAREGKISINENNRFDLSQSKD